MNEKYPRDTALPFILGFRLVGHLHQTGRLMARFCVRNSAVIRRYAASIDTTFESRRLLMSRIGGWPNIRLYSRLNWLTLSYPTS